MTNNKHTVSCYNDGSKLAGTPSQELVSASMTERSGTGAVAAYIDDDGVWQHVAEDQIYRMKRAGVDVVTVYVEA